MRRESDGNAILLFGHCRRSVPGSHLHSGTSRLLPRGRQWADGARQRTAAKEKQIKSDTHPVCPPHGLCGDQVFRPPGKGAGSMGLPMPAGPIRTIPVITKMRPIRAASSSKRLFFWAAHDPFSFRQDEKKMGVHSPGNYRSPSAPPETERFKK